MRRKREREKSIQKLTPGEDDNEDSMNLACNNLAAVYKTLWNKDNEEEGGWVDGATVVGKKYTKERIG